MICCQSCGRMKADERKAPGPCWRFKRHAWGEWNGMVYTITPDTINGRAPKKGKR